MLTIQKIIINNITRVSFLLLPIVKFSISFSPRNKGDTHTKNVRENNTISTKTSRIRSHLLSGLYPIDFDTNGVYELLAFRRIVGRYNADTLGYMQTACTMATISWNFWRAARLTDMRIETMRCKYMV